MNQGLKQVTSAYTQIGNRNEGSTLHVQLKVHIYSGFKVFWRGSFSFGGEGIFIFKVFTHRLTGETLKNWKKFLYLGFLHYSETLETFKCASILSGFKQ